MPGTRLIIAFAVLGTMTCLLPRSASAVSQAGAIVDVFSPSARGAALADAGGLVPEGPFALRWNAAGLALDQPASVGFTYNEVAKGLADDVWIYHVGGTVQWKMLGFGAMYSRLDQGSQESSGTNPGNSESHDSHEDALRFGAAVDVLGFMDDDMGDYHVDLVLGVGAKHFGIHLAPPSVTQDLGVGGAGEASAWTMDAGAMLRFGRFADLGSGAESWFGVRGSFAYDCLLENDLEFEEVDQSDPLPTRIRYGAAFEADLFAHPSFGHLVEVLVAYERLESKVSRDDTKIKSLGLEIGVANTLILRGGSYDDEEGDIVGGTFGVGLRLAPSGWRWGFQLDYADRPQARDLERVQMFTATVGFDVFD